MNLSKDEHPTEMPNIMKLLAFIINYAVSTTIIELIFYGIISMGIEDKRIAIITTIIPFLAGILIIFLTHYLFCTTIAII